jgi:hypothetical protein
VLHCGGRWRDSTALDNALDLDDPIQDLTSAKEIVEELRHQDSTKACGVDGVHIRLMQALTLTPFVNVLAALYNSCIRYTRTPRVWNDTIVCVIVNYSTGRPICIRYTIIWKIKLNNGMIATATEQDIMLAPAPYWPMFLEDE